MRGLTLNNVCHFGLFAFLVFFSFTSFTGAVSFDLTELRNKVAKIKVNPRGNLWATGHFMGKKSVMDPPVLPPAEERDVGALQAALAAERSALGELFPEFRRARMDAPESRAKNQEADLLVKIVESYIQSRE